MDEEMEDVARQVMERMERKSALLGLLHDGHLDEEILAEFLTGDEGWKLLPLDLN